MYLLSVSSWPDPDEEDDATTGGKEESPGTAEGKEAPQVIGDNAATGGLGEEKAPQATEGTPEDLIAWYNSAIKDYDAMFLIYYRGVW